MNTGRKLNYKSLRKAYITNLEIFMGIGNTKAITGHSNNQVIKKNYIDQKEMAKAAIDFRVFLKKDERNNTLKEICNKHNVNEKEIEINVWKQKTALNSALIVNFQF